MGLSIFIRQREALPVLACCCVMLRAMTVDLPDTRGSHRIVLPYEPPYDFPLVLGFLGKRAIPGVERVDAAGYERVFGPHDKSTWMRVSADAAGSALVLTVTGRAARKLLPDIVQRTRRMFDLDADLRPVHAALSASALLQAGIARRPGLRVPGSWDGFELAVRAVIGQQVSVAAATTLTRRLVEKYGVLRSAAPAGLDRVFPGPEQLAEATLDGIGLPQSRIATLRGLAQAVIAGDVNFSAGQDLQDFVASMVRLRGIGPWTAHYVAMRALRHPDAFPAGDLVLQQMLGGERRLSERETEAASQAWRPWRAYSVLHLWYLSGDRREERRGK
jgi:AraC family transcriptional regulator of adaptative response / DNA-3-methyladenine glycosylase II